MKDSPRWSVMLEMERGRGATHQLIKKLCRDSAHRSSVLN